ncbi:TIGR01440 family protein [Paenibacillus sp. 481]|uniref:TIGR01440 family protein n=1 Tax=Paenibacillus sp. 481 TaxID=2835869 RepID=UPI001E40F3DE|nr:TIGR01440 family protein [Paenibacillus sp. 481]UHA75651.1 TIGR01440 family protein [Paenibacillus sp. 481]
MNDNNSSIDHVENELKRSRDAQSAERVEQVTAAAERAARTLVEAAELKSGQIVVIGCSTSEIIGRRIGTSGAIEIAQQLLAGFDVLRTEYGLHVAYQCCEHLNRALVVERRTLDMYRLEEVAAVPVPKAGGSMAASAYLHLPDACLAESISAHAGIDIGETLIGMHLRHVAVPLRTEVRFIGEARVAMARTRPKLIGGERAVYQLPQDAAGNCE